MVDMVGDFKYIYNNNMYYGAKRTAEFSRFVLGVGFFSSWVNSSANTHSHVI